MFDVIVSGVILAAISGSAFVACTHPKTFDRMSGKFMYTFIFSWLAIGVGVELLKMGYRHSRQLVTKDPSAVEKIGEKLESISSFHGTATLVLFGCMAYTFFLLLVVAKIKTSDSEGSGE